jgi:large subunit ribosomal protein L32
MVVPTKKLSKSRYKKRRFQKDKLEKLNLQRCQNCNALILPHRACPECGFYKGSKKL